MWGSCVDGVVGSGGGGLRQRCRLGNFGWKDGRVIIEKGKISGCRCCSGLFGKREGIFVKNYMARDYYFMCGEVKATIAAMVRGIP